MSFLTSGVNGMVEAQFGYSDGTQGAYTKIQDGLVSFSNTSSKPVSRIFMALKGRASASILAAKLELGDKQTLAHQDASGNWVLNDPPPHPATELAKCQRYQLVFSKSASVVGHGIAQNPASVLCEIPTPATMRNTPTVTPQNLGLFGAGGLTTENALDVTGIFGTIVTPNGIRLQLETSGATTGNGYVVVVKNDGKLTLDANL